ncbi:hypothetical protein HPB50_017618 [Hyalomma asiaticum]|uniref:Uncharacterized protein n=1 Tax=Hyalomma asiaticum TaxID=266040 RepID=A0ACB7T7J6_HYAAI|nr:hypothetical protein HPB50_017618 [Hyalomma asiaticum]
MDAAASSAGCNGGSGSEKGPWLLAVLGKGTASCEAVTLSGRALLTGRTGNITCEVKDMLEDMSTTRDPPPGVHVVPVGNQTGRIHALVVGPADTPYESGFFHFLIEWPPEYPFKPPRVRLMNTDGGRVRFSQHFFATGMVCLGILDTFPRPAWSPTMHLEDVLVSIESLLSKRPYFDQPGIHGELREGDSERYHRVMQHETVRVAECDTS